MYDPITGEQMDEEWQPLSSSWHKTKPPPATTQSRKHPAENSAAGDQHLPQVNNSAPHADEGRRAAAPAVIGSRIKSSGEHMVATIEEKAGGRHHHHPPQAYSQNRLSSLLFKHKEQLKKEIARKRNVLEKELSQDISREVDSLKQQAALKLGAEGLGFGNSSAAGRKRRSQEAPGAGAQQQYSSQQAAIPAPSAAAPTSSFKTSNAAHQVPGTLQYFPLLLANYGTVTTASTYRLKGKCERLVEKEFNQFILIWFELRYT